MKRKKHTAHRQRTLARRAQKRRLKALQRPSRAMPLFDEDRMQELESIESSLDFPHNILRLLELKPLPPLSTTGHQGPRRALLTFSFDEEGELEITEDGDFDYAAHAHECSVCAAMAATGP